MNVKNDLLYLNKGNLELKSKPMNLKQTIIGKSLMGPPATVGTPAFRTNKTHSMFTPLVVPSSSRSKSSVPSELQIVLAICEGRGNARGIVGIAAMNMHHPALVLYQIPDGQTYTNTLTKLNILRPIEILIPTHFVEAATPNRLFTIVSEKCPSATVTSIPRNEFNRNRGLQYISNLCADRFSSVKLIIQAKFYAASAASALIRYIENMKHISYAQRSIKVEYQESEHTTMIDIDTANLLNLVAAYKNNDGLAAKAKIKPCLLGVIDKCVTNVGRRLLRTCVLQPPCRPLEIETRHDCVSELIAHRQLLFRLRDVLVPLHNIENSLAYATLVPVSAISVSEKQLNYTLQLKMHLIAIDPLAQELRHTKHPSFRNIYDRLNASDTYSIILQLINSVLNEDAQFAKGQIGEIQRCFAIKTGINGFLDIARKLYTEIVNNMRLYVETLSQEYNLPLRAQHTHKMGFHIVLPLTNATKNMRATELPDVFYKIERYSKHFAMTTMDMISFGKQIKNTSAEIQSISNVIIYKLLTDIRPYIGDLYQLCDDVAFLDMLVSLSIVSSTSGYTRPLISKSYMLIEQFKHPILEHTLMREPVTNSVCAIPQSNVQIITGPNMSGKTMYVRALCLIQILSQVGCRVPAEKATIRPCDRLYAQLANDMTLECGGMSSFTVEMNKIAHLLQTMSDRSFIVLDELCTTTNHEEGLSFAFAICEELAQRKAFAFVVTHYLSLGALADLYPNVTNWQFEALENLRANGTRASLKFTHKQIPGITKIDAYGIKLARVCVNCNSIVDRAEALWKWMAPHGKTLHIVNASGTIEYLRKKLQAELNILKVENKLTAEMKHSKITEFKTLTANDFVPSDSESIERISTEKTNSIAKRSVPNSSDDLVGTSSLSVDSTNMLFSVYSPSLSSTEPQSDKMFSCCDNSEQISFHDPLNYIIKSTISSKRQNSFSQNESISYVSNSISEVPIDSIKEIVPEKTVQAAKTLVSDLYFSSSSDEVSDDDHSIDNDSVLSVDHQTFVNNIQSSGILTSTPIRRNAQVSFNESENDFQIKIPKKYSNLHVEKINYKIEEMGDISSSSSSEIALSFLPETNRIEFDSTKSSEVNSAKSLFSDPCFKFVPKCKKRKFIPPFKTTVHSNGSEVKRSASSIDVFSQETIVQDFS